MDINNSICNICGQSTSRIEFEYLIGTNHLSCELSNSDITRPNLPISN
jgi:hypothetical protein